MPDLEHAVPSLEHPKRSQSNAIFAALIGGGISLVVIVIGLVLIGLKINDVAQDSITALSTIGGTLAGGFGGWIARGLIISNSDDTDRSD